MRRTCLFLVVFLCVTMVVNAAISVYGLTCEQIDEPVGVDVACPRFSWKLHGTSRGIRQSAYQVIVADEPEKLDEGKTDVWDSGKIVSDCSLLVPFGGKSLAAATAYYWKVRVWDESGECSGWSETAKFVTGMMETADWNGARWIAMEQDGELVVPLLPWIPDERKAAMKSAGEYKMPMFRKKFRLPEKEIKQAYVYVCGLGHFDLFLNGKKVGNHFLDPGWTKYDKEALYVAFDVTDELCSGDNVFGVMLGNGFYNVSDERYFKIAGTFGAPKMKLNLVVRYSDNTVRCVVSDKTWKAVQSPVVYSGIYGGEDYDATRECDGWTENRAAFDDKEWRKVVVTEQDIELKSQLGTQLAVRKHLPVVSLYRNDNGCWIYDLGQNFAGIIRVRVKGKRGQTVVFRPAELLNEDKSVNQSASGSPYYFSYTLKGDGKAEQWQPQFSYYGFRYVQLEGAVPAGCENPDSLPEIVELEGLHVCSGLPEVGTFHCSKPMFNQIYNLIDWAVRSNMMSVLTDCPHREKLGWLEQAHLMQYSIQYRYFTPLLYRKMMADMAASQLDNGTIPTIAPEYVRFDGGFEDTPEWGSAFIISPWYIYKWYGDRSLIDEYYPAMKRYVEYLGSRAENHIVAYGLGDWYDIGPNKPGYAQLTSNGVTATAIYYYDVSLMREMAALLGKDDDESYFAGLAEKIKTAYNEKFFNKENGAYDRNSQTANAISLFMNLVAEENRDKVLENLMNDIERRGCALTAGDIGYRYVLRALEREGAPDLIFRMNCKYDVPGYGWQLAHGATALTESWQAYGFVSNNHFMLGHLMEWLFGGLGGLKQDEGSVAYKRLYIDPQVVGDVDASHISYESPYGRVECEWKLDVDKYVLRVVIPANSEAVVCLPTEDMSKVTEFGRPVTGHPDVRVLGTTSGKTKLLVGSGEYMFRVDR